MRGWRDGGRTRWFQWPVRVVSTDLQHVRTVAALEDLDKRDVVIQTHEWVSAPDRVG